MPVPEIYDLLNKVFKYVTEIVLAYGVLEPLHVSCKIDTKTANTL